MESMTQRLIDENVSTTVTQILQDPNYSLTLEEKDNVEKYIASIPHLGMGGNRVESNAFEHGSSGKTRQEKQAADEEENDFGKKLENLDSLHKSLGEDVPTSSKNTAVMETKFKEIEQRRKGYIEATLQRVLYVYFWSAAIHPTYFTYCDHIEVERIQTKDNQYRQGSSLPPTLVDLNRKDRSNQPGPTEQNADRTFLCPLGTGPLQAKLRLTRIQAEGFVAALRSSRSPEPLINAAWAHRAAPDPYKHKLRLTRVESKPNESLRRSQSSRSS
ncbi:uncharacterized protein PGTG_15543 [Puccinia graminis f. sp. tritici CRL 75-36-700-3]|uniref:Uncharacterized protein n=1 Tax=Puccinia graminis f. sp. tritici (strain CRL 75-36-700-3 / race SCCL) TaxID=418459 RepID=E3KYH3_PUCGT|nr:uncharacterized protein PGTG_15543 [Puccinia graminis f. sp. tritici CRL 75-36-700-3]EFP89364.2 hypothetical protein PGTG_15543 [Puccinia graminis f. sp. tritici CRL 75-36-700-3]